MLGRVERLSLKLRKQILMALMTDFAVVEGWDQPRASQNHFGKRSQPSAGIVGPLLSCDIVQFSVGTWLILVQ